MISGKMMRDAVISAANNISNNRSKVDALNVFPVPDGDTGTNMSMTMRAGADAAATLGDSVSVSEAADTVASALLRGARGNSGVILSLIFIGMSKGLKGCSYANAMSIAAALEMGSRSAYETVTSPVEGTILTVIRTVASRAKECAESEESAVKVFGAALENGRETLSKTPELLPALKKAKVVDAGGQGLIYIFEGMASVFEKGEIIVCDSELPKKESETAAAKQTGEIKFTYCTEFLIQKKEDEGDIQKLKKFLNGKGDCVAVVEDGDIIKVHVHSNEPGVILTRALDMGELLNIKIDNMKAEHKNAKWGAQPADYKEPEEKSAAPVKKYGFVCVAAGEGISKAFKELGADNIVSGGQTMNPSTEDILKAIEMTPAEEIFVLPNNKNIILTAMQAAPLTKKTVRILKTASVPQGIAAMLEFDEYDDYKTNKERMTRKIEQVFSVLVTFAARDSVIGNKPVKKGDIITLENGKVVRSDPSPMAAAFKSTVKLSKRSTQLVTVFYGDGVTNEQANDLARRLRTKLSSSIQINVVNGGQPIYYYIISIE